MAARTRISDLPLQRDQRSDQIIQTILTALPVTPRQTAIQTGRSTFDYALDDLRGARATALEALHRVTVSELGYLTADADAADGETVAFLDRYARAHQQAAPTALRAAAQVALARELADVIDTARVGIPLRRVDTGTTTVLYQLGDAAPAIVSGGTIHPFGPYRDPAHEAQRVGGADMQTPVAGTDYVANTAAEGSGTDVTSQLTVTARFGASGVRWTITNPGPGTVYLTRLQARGRGIYDYARAYLEAVAPSGAARLYFDAVTGLVKVSVDGGAYRPLGGGTVWPLGGHPDFQQTSGAFDTIYGPEVLQPSYARTGTVHAMARVDGGTGQLRVYNVTDAAVVGTAWDVTNTTVALVISGELTLAGGTQYRVEAKRGTTWIKVWGAKFVES